MTLARGGRGVQVAKYVIPCHARNGRSGHLPSGRPLPFTLKTGRGYLGEDSMFKIGWFVAADLDILPLAFSNRRGLLLLGLIFVCLFTLPSSAMAQSCPSEPPNISLQDRTLAVTVFNRSDETWQTYEVTPGDPPSVAFNQNRLCFFYGVRSDSGRTGALVIPVIRRFSMPVGDNSDRVLLTRGGGFFRQDGTSKERWDGSRTVNFYNQFHVQNLSDPDFREDFHGYWRPGDESSSTADPRSRLRAFTYMEDESVSVLRRTYLLRYSTSSQGSWIPFYIETAGEPQNLNEVRLRVWDFGLSTDEQVFTGSVVR